MICEIGRQTVMLNQFAKFCTLKIMFINVIDRKFYGRHHDLANHKGMSVSLIYFFCRNTGARTIHPSGVSDRVQPRHFNWVRIAQS
jgi:hypothetical protein